MTGEPTGRHLGKKLADIMHDARVTAGSRLIQVETDHRAKYHTSFMEGTEQELAPTFRRMFAWALEDPDVPDEAKAMLEPLCHPEHQGQFFLDLAALVGLALSGPGAAAAGWLQRLQTQSMRAHGDVRLTPDQAALAVLKGWINQEQGADEARASGMRADAFQGLVDIAGEPPGPMQLLEAYRRGYIDQGRLHHGILQSRIRPEWIDVIERLRFAPPSAAEAIAAEVEGHLDKGETERLMAEAGLDPKNHDWMYETAGRPPGAQEMIQLWRRGDATEAEVAQAIRESNIKVKYIPAILKMRRHIPPPRSVVAMLRHGAIDDPTATFMLNAGGVMGPDAEAMIRDAHSTAGSHVRDISLAETVSLFMEGLIDRARAVQMLEALRYSAEASDQILHLAEVKRQHAIIAASVGRVRSAFVGHRIDRSTASVRLDAIGMDHEARDQAMKLWDEERLANRHTLTEPQVAKAWSLGLLDDEQFLVRHREMGYTDEDAQMLLAIHQAS